MLVRGYSPIRFECFVDLLGGGSCQGVPHGRSTIDPGGWIASLKDNGGGSVVDGRLFVAGTGRAGRLLETLYLKLRLFADAVQGVHAMVFHTQRPFLSLTPDSFCVRFAEPACALPFLWTARAVLSAPGDAISLSIPASDMQYFLPSQKYVPPIYRPPVSSYAAGRGSVRIPRIISDPSGATILEITFTTQAPIDPARNDIMHLRLNLADTPLDVYARSDQDATMAPGEWRFRTIQQQFGEPVLTKLRAAEGAEVRGISFELVPLLSTPCDLYALAVLAVRTLLVSPNVTHAVALDKMLSLARQLASNGGASSPLGQRIAELFKRDNRWMETLGPQQLTREPVLAAEAFDLVPSELWFDVLATMLRMFPAVGPLSICRDYGDAPPGGIHKVFESTLADLGSLLLRARSLIVVDWRQNREIEAVIAKCLAGMPPPAAKPAAPA
jgi:hypothetical protein